MWRLMQRRVAIASIGNTGVELAGSISPHQQALNTAQDGTIARGRTFLLILAAR